MIAAFAEPGVLDRGFALPEILPGAAFPAAQAISFHFIDYVVHGWDVASSLGRAYVLDDDLVRAALPVAEAVPDGARRLRPGAAFAPGLDSLPAADTDPMGRILALLGRSRPGPHRPERPVRPRRHPSLASSASHDHGTLTAPRAERLP